MSVKVSEKKRSVDLILCILLGYLGIHRFYEGKIGTGILYLVTLGIGGIGWLIDIFIIACGSGKDKWGHRISNW